MEIQPLGCCFDSCVLRLLLLVASVPSSPAGGRDGVCLPLDHVVRCSSASGAVVRVLASWGPLLVPGSFDSPATEILSFFLDSFEMVVEWFSSSHCWSLLHWRHLSVFRPASAGDRYISSLRAGDCGLPLRRRVHALVLMAACLSLLRVWWTAPSHIPLMLCASTGIFFSGQSWPLLEFPLCGFSAGLCRSYLASPFRCLSESASALHRLISPHCGFV